MKRLFVLLCASSSVALSAQKPYTSSSPIPITGNQGIINKKIVIQELKKLENVCHRRGLTEATKEVKQTRKKVTLFSYLTDAEREASVLQCNKIEQAIRRRSRGSSEEGSTGQVY